MAQVVRVFPYGQQRSIYPIYCQYHGYWWPSDIRSQGISSNVIDLVLPGYSGISTRKDNYKILNAIYYIRDAVVYYEPFTSMYMYMYYYILPNWSAIPNRSASFFSFCP